MGDERYHCTLADACKAVNYGLTASASSHPIGPRFLRITDIVPGFVDWNTVPYVAADNDLLTKYALDDGDIVIARTGASTGASAYVKSPPSAVFASYLVRLKVKPEFDARYVSYFMKSPMFLEYIRGVLGDKSAQPNASASTMTAAPLSAPRDKLVQRAIAHILGTLDDKIELNRRMNETLEAMARALFKDWFVDYGPVHARMNGRAPYLRLEVWDVFPDAFDEEAKPVGWGKGYLGALFDVSIGRTPPRKERQHFVEGGQGKTWLSIKRMGALQTFACTSDEDITLEAVRQYRIPLVRVGTVLVSFKLTVGRVAIAAKDMHTNEAIAHLVENDESPVSNFFTYCFMKNFNFRSLASTSSIATAVNSKTIKGIEMIVPQREAHAAFVGIARPVFDRILSNVRQSESLAATRDLLLPKLVSGEIRLREAEKMVEAVG